MSRGKETVSSTDLGLLGTHARSQLLSGSTEQQDTSAKRALQQRAVQQRQSGSRLEREARKARNLLFANAWLGLTVDGKKTKYFRMLAWFKEQNELALHRRTNKNHSLLNGASANPHYSSLGGAGHGPMANETGKLERPAPDFESGDWQSPSEPPPSKPPKRAKIVPEQLCVAQRTTEPFDISFIFGTGATLPTCEQLDECMRREVVAAKAPAAAPLAYRNEFGEECDADVAVDYRGGRENTMGREHLLCNVYFSTMRAATDKRSSPVERVDQVVKG